MNIVLDGFGQKYNLANIFKTISKKSLYAKTCSIPIIFVHIICCV